MAVESKPKGKKQDQLDNASSNIGRVGWLTVMSTIILVCLAVHTYIMKFTSPQFIPAMEYTGQYGDVFFVYKWIFLLLGTGIVTIMLLINMVKNGYAVKKSPANVPLAVLASLLVISTIFSEYPYIALQGVVDIFMGSVRIIVMLLFCWLILNLYPHPNRFKYIVIGFATLIVLQLTICTGTFYGIQWHTIPGFRDLILGADAANTSFNGSLVSTLNNPNYTSGLFGAIAAMFLCLAATLNERKSVIICCVSGCLSAFIVFTQLSTSGFVAFIAGIIIIASLLAIYRERPVFSYIALSAAILVILLGGYVFNLHNESVYSNTTGWFQKAFTVMSSSPSEEEQPLTVRETTTPDDKFNLDRTSTDRLDSFRLLIAQETWKLIKAKPLLGYGMDTLVYYYPVTSRETVKQFGAEQYLTKPHNMYLQIAYGAGIPALLCLIWLISAYLWFTVRLIYTSVKTDGTIPAWPAAVMCFVIAFCVQGLVNDLVIGTGTIFFALLGMGFGLLNDYQPVKEQTAASPPERHTGKKIARAS